jgi:hypothetical protein
MFGKTESTTKSIETYKQHGVDEYFGRKFSFDEIVINKNLSKGYGVFKITMHKDKKHLDIFGVEVLRSTFITFTTKRLNKKSCSKKLTTFIHKDGFTTEISNDEICPKRYKDIKWEE